MDRTIVKKYFDENSGYWISNSYEKQEFTYPTALARLGKTLAVINSEFPPSREIRIVDLGCGGGHLCFEAAAQGYQTVGIDASDAMIREVTVKRDAMAENVRSRIEFRQGHLVENGLPPGSAEAVTSLGVIGYLPDDDGLFQEAVRLLKPGGLFIVSSRNKLFNMVSISDYTLREIHQGTAAALVEEIRELMKPVPRDESAEFLKQLSRASAELLRQGIKSAPNPDTHPAEKQLTFKVDPRQHSPKQFLAVAERYGLKLEKFLGVHPHLLMAGMNRLLPPFVFNTLSSSLEPLDGHPLSLIWSSVILGVFRKKK